jgi:hypothetical protein
MAKAAGMKASRQTVDRAYKKLRDTGFNKGRLVT